MRSGIIGKTEVIIPAAGEIAASTLPLVLERARVLGFERLTVVDGGGLGRSMEHLDAFPHGRIISKPQPRGGFSRARMLNHGVSKSEARFVLLLDSDILLSGGYVRNGADIVAGFALALPRGVRLTQRETEIYRNIRSLPTEFKLRNACGGANWIDRQVFIRLGGLRTCFTGWWGEEFEFAWRAERLGVEIERPEEPVFHLWHETAPRKDEGYFKHARQNRDEFERIKREDACRVAFVAD